MMRLSLSIMLALTIFGCADAVDTNAPTKTLQWPAIEAPLPNAVTAELSSLATAVLVAPQSRPPRRISVRQLDRSIERLVGFPWVGLEELALSMGMPNFVDITQQDLSISPLFLKFLNDAARSICTGRVAMDFAPQIGESLLVVGVEATDTFETAPEAMETALKQLLLKMHGTRVEGAELDRWKTLFTTAAATDSPEIGWRTVCVAAMTHPNFYTF